MRKVEILYVWLLLALASFASAPQEKEDKSLTLHIGIVSYRNQVVEVLPGMIVSEAKGKAVDFARMAKEMKDVPFIFIGENHDSLPMHEVQLKTIETVYAQDNRISIGLEMLPVTYQPQLDKWTAGSLTKDEFIREGKWYINWNLNFGYYEKIFDFARENKIPMWALNAPKDLITTIRMKGWDALGEDEKKIVPRPDLTNQEHRQLIRTILESAELPHQMKETDLDMVFEGLYRAQVAWDEVMAANAVRAYQEDGRRMIVLAGSGHLLYNLGINLRIHEKTRLASKTVICVPVPKGKAGLTVTRSLGDYVWGLPEEDRPAFPSVGLSFKKFEGLDNLAIDGKPIEGAAKGGDFEKGDIVLAVDGKRFDDINEARTYLAQFRWGDEVKFRLLRSAQVKEVALKFEASKDK